MSWPTSNSSTVIRFRNSETAVTPSDCSMPKRVISKNDRSWPTSVMSVPCSVVTTPSGRGATICLARYALAA